MVHPGNAYMDNSVEKSPRWLATAAFGLEAVVRRELEAMDIPVDKVEDGRVWFHGGPEVCVRANLGLRASDRVLLLLDDFPCLDPDTLFRHASQIPWENLIPADGAFPVLAGTVKSALRSEPNTQKTVKKAAALRLGRAYGLTHLPETGGTYTIHVNLLRDRCTISVDTTGESLHKRGYRTHAVAAPLKETLAAALLELSFWRPGRSLLDPCAGSGTLLIEAALMGRRIAPGLSRHFACEDWALIPKSVWQRERKQAFQAIDQTAPLDIRGGDIDGRALDQARRNAEEAGVSEDIQLRRCDLTAILDPAALPPYGVIVTNPPYGERIGSDRSVRHVERALADFFKARPDWSLFVITSDKDFERKVMGRKADRRRKLYNGRMEVTYYQFHGERPPRKPREEEDSRLKNGGEAVTD